MLTPELVPDSSYYHITTMRPELSAELQNDVFKPLERNHSSKKALNISSTDVCTLMVIMSKQEKAESECRVPGPGSFVGSSDKRRIITLMDYGNDLSEISRRTEAGPAATPQLAPFSLSPIPLAFRSVHLWGSLR
ncbi:hypothetical protein TNCV_1076661 [Trichonephila clavipes]|uniref:Uncharacterized protein n=1 Tax=Trichonephila clavipes TaxID=2585209 RepID=A0A8X6RMP5_TRICX|nr:hypothetical protein TNCV_1076661 [Trichonephila clavipes]